MKETELLLVGFALVASSGLSWVLGLLSGSAVQRGLSTPRADLLPRTHAGDDEDDDRGEVIDYSVLQENRGRGTDEDVAALRRVRESDEAERTASTRGFRGEDLSDREVTEWLERFGL